MYYYKIKDSYVIQYSVQIDIDRLKKLRTDIIENCSTIQHMHYKTIRRPNQYDTERIRNYRQKFVRVIQYNDLCKPDDNEYDVEYDQLIHHDLVSYIDSLIKGNTCVIDKIENVQGTNYDKEMVLLEEQEKLIKDLNSCNHNEVRAIVLSLNQNLEKLTQCSKEKELNKNQSPISFYQKQVLECIHLKEVSKLSLDTVIEIQDFLKNYNENTAEDSLSKVLALKK